MILSFLKNVFQTLTLKTESYYLQNSFNASLRPTALAGVIAKLDDLQDDTASDKICVGRQVKLVNMQDQQEYHIELVYPPKHKPSAGRFSVISDLGASLLGLSKGEMAQVNILGKPVLFMITQVTSNKKARTTSP